MTACGARECRRKGLRRDGGLPRRFRCIPGLAVSCSESVGPGFRAGPCACRRCAWGRGWCLVPLSPHCAASQTCSQERSLVLYDDSPPPSKGGEQPGLFLGNFDGRRLCQATTSARQKVSAVSQRRARGAQLPRRKAGVELFHLVPGRFGLPEDKPLRAQGFPDCGVMQCEAGRKQLRFRPLPYVELPVGLSEVEASRGSQRKSHVSPVSPRLDRSISSCESRGWRT